VKSWRWIQREALVRLHAMSLVQFGGLPGLRDAGVLDSALARPEQMAHYGKPDIADFAASYAYGLARNHPFVDGNKRVAFLALGLSLRLNGHSLIASQPEATQIVLSLAGGELSEEALAAWVRVNIQVMNA
jgi:death-on-curing protein